MGCDRKARAETKLTAQIMLSPEGSFYPGECVLNFGREIVQGVTVLRQLDAAR